jgi:hypothetical protein
MECNEWQQVILGAKKDICILTLGVPPCVEILWLVTCRTLLKYTPFSSIRRLDLTNFSGTYCTAPTQITCHFSWGSSLDQNPEAIPAATLILPWPLSSLGKQKLSPLPIPGPGPYIPIPFHKDRREFNKEYHTMTPQQWSRQSLSLNISHSLGQYLQGALPALSHAKQSSPMSPPHTTFYQPTPFSFRPHVTILTAAMPPTLCTFHAQPP